ncbi:SHOCT domain-containing protein [Clostridioides sp. ZZV15-6598]|uniref:SHOCT domain-containing protein n=1 Tax=Clostridioides sp. ZZV15-6598 TaxID=2811501 RepID=UPI001D113F1E|nr:SHOCT domain-containing protein [Clostridioides sp. ZZV15-6598]
MQIKDYIDNYKPKTNVQSQAIIHQNNSSVADEILKFKNLVDIGVITEDEFDKKKKELLNV